MPLRSKKSAAPAAATNLFQDGPPPEPPTSKETSPNRAVASPTAKADPTAAAAEAKEVAELKDLFSSPAEPPPASSEDRSQSPLPVATGDAPAASDRGSRNPTPPGARSGKAKGGKAGSAKAGGAKANGKAAGDAKGAASEAKKDAGRAFTKKDKNADASAALEFLLSGDQLRAIVDRWEQEALGFEAEAAKVPVDFERTVGMAIRKVVSTKAEFVAFVDVWDKNNTGLKKVDFRRQMRGTSVTGLKMHAGNHEIDYLFDSITGGGGAATATVKQLVAVLWPMAQKAGVTDPEIERLNAKATACREEKKTVITALDALEATESTEAELRANIGDDAPVVAQLGHLVQKRNMKVGEVIAKWGSVDHTSFRHHVRTLGVVANDERIDAVFDTMDDDGGGTLDADELKDGLKMLIDSAKANDKAIAALEKQAHNHRKNAAAQIATLHKQEQVRAERVRIEAEAAAKAEAERLEREATLAAEQKRLRDEAEAKKRAEKEALSAQIAAQKKAARGEKPRGGDGVEGEDSEEHTHIAQWKIEAQQRAKAEEQWNNLRKHFKRSWRPPGLHGTH